LLQYRIKAKHRQTLLDWVKELPWSRACK
jgi:hypothetical protein